VARKASHLSLREGHIMSDRAKEERQWTSDIVWAALYSILLLLLMVAWTGL